MASRLKAIENINISNTSIIAFLVGFTIISINFTMFINTEWFVPLNFLSALIVLGFPLGTRYIKYTRVKKIDSAFPDFLRDITTNIKAGMTLPQAVKATRTNDYGVLTPYVKKIIAKIDWGISFEKVLANFANQIDSPMIKRSVKTINETHRSGGNIGEVLMAVAESVQEMENIRRERSSRVYAQMINGYVIFFVFLGVMWGLSNFLVPAFQYQSEMDIVEMQRAFNELFLNLILIQGVSAGLAIGQMAEGSLTGGLKHSFVLCAIGYTVFAIL
ncbi:MAG: hypothetical protein B6U68_03590 [Candidatus Aenigmarchaeota archaeon ex4484_14]|nr:MAG: hypothetical protein B6U68_03590 [Candidatus Aenigmarchaeota archaeon ex4484_14]